MKLFVCLFVICFKKLNFEDNTLAGNLFKPPSNSSGLFTASAAQALTSQPQSRGLGGTNQSSLLTTGQGTVGKPRY